tara:strand:+ start:61 stop:318 length:258 start_codon:yes stop_codon:yes gene_type:complete
MKKPFKMKGMSFKEGQSPIRKFNWAGIGSAALEGGVDRLGEEAGISGLGGSVSDMIKGMHFGPTVDGGKVKVKDLDPGPGVKYKE